ncbi:AraC family transcriptional regulator [Methylopila jiangsuensis]|uniref:AraC family transcriptional regulator n=1 Tax=Methylopila jiangsuensis TaxID=586230 RepID=A0A9W6N476_9HYPH|nr:AraC family transcriptional regulator [Methylopila jiangsuensis]MDR6286810.1 AraC-like DNA-binding protein [Methylopila jiangsuensis]GLK76842.1 AraC family transcriptional regulator [Methylopila jiangsuensis]
MTRLGLTRARSIGAITDAVEQAGGSVARVFARAEMSQSLLQEPDRPILLRDQACLMACAVDELGDPTLPARLAGRVGALGLGPLGRVVCSADTLRDAIRRAEMATPELLQTATWTGLKPFDAAHVLYGYKVTERMDVGRQLNEVLALGYLLDVVRHFMGPGWRPERAVVTGAALPGRSDIEAAFRCDVTLGGVAGVLIRREDLAARNPAPPPPANDDAIAPLPALSDLVSCVEHVLMLQPRLDRSSVEWVCGRLGMSRRTFQRRLSDDGVTFSSLLQHVLLRKAQSFLSDRSMSISQIAFELGYADPAHFSRAFSSWTGVSPRGWRNRRTCGHHEGKMGRSPEEGALGRTD